MLRVHSPDFMEGADIPREFTCEGGDGAPRLLWEGAPEATKGFLLVVEDPDAPMGTFVHWSVYDIPGDMKGLGGAGAPAGVKQGMNDFGRKGYLGPCPPKGHGTHRYNFILRALDVPTLDLPDGAKIGDIERAARGHTLAEARTMGRFRR